MSQGTRGKVIIANKDVKFHTVALEELILDGAKITIKFDDVAEKRWQIMFAPYQGFKVTTIDCADRELFTVDGKCPRCLLEILDSPWIDELKNVLKEVDHDADFMEKAHHYVMRFYDDLVEIIAWESYELRLIPLENGTMRSDE